MALEMPLVGLAVRPRVVRAWGWAVTSCEGPGGVVRVVRGRDGLRIAVGDQSADADHRTRVALSRDGVATVRAAATPPALLVSPRAARTVPAVPGIPERTTLSTADRLLVLSADALDALPESLASVLQALPAKVSGRDPADLLTELFADLPSGSGVIVVRTAVKLTPDLAPDPAPDPAHEEATWGSAERS
jgi:hypothetical protein